MNKLSTEQKLANRDIKKAAKAWLIEHAPLMKCGNMTEHYQRLQWLSEGMLHNHMHSVIHYCINIDEVELYKEYKLKLGE